MTYPVSAPLEDPAPSGDCFSLIAIDKEKTRFAAAGLPEDLVFHREDLYEFSCTYWWTRPESYQRHASIEHHHKEAWLRWSGENGSGWRRIDQERLSTAVMLLDASDPNVSRDALKVHAHDQKGTLSFSQLTADSVELALSAERSEKKLLVKGSVRPNSVLACLNHEELKLETFSGEDLLFSRHGGQTVVEVGDRTEWALRFRTGQIVRALHIAMSRHL